MPDASNTTDANSRVTFYTGLSEVLKSAVVPVDVRVNKILNNIFNIQNRYLHHR